MAKPVRIEIEVDEKGAVKSLTNFDDALKRIPNSGKAATHILREMRQEQKQAADAADLLGDRLGVTLPREVRKFISETKMIGPALATAFNASIFLALGAALFEALSNMDKLTDKLVDWSGATARGREELEKMNAVIVEHNKKLVDLQRANALIGVTGVGGAKQLQVGFAQEDLAQLQGRLNALLATRKTLMETAKQTTTFVDESGGTTILPSAAAKSAIESLGAVNEQVSFLGVQVSEATQAIANLNKELGDEFNKAAAKMLNAGAGIKSMWTAIAEGAKGFRPSLVRQRDFEALGPAPKLTGFWDMPDKDLTDSDLFRDWDKEMEELNKGLAGMTAETHQLNEFMLEKIETDRKSYERMIENISDGAGRVFDSMLAGGKSVFASLADFAKSVLLVPLRGMFQKLMVDLFRDIPGLSRLSGGGAGSPAAIGFNGGSFGDLFRRSPNISSTSSVVGAGTSFGTGLSSKLGIPLTNEAAPGWAGGGGAASSTQATAGMGKVASGLTAAGTTAGIMLFTKGLQEGNKLMGIAGGGMAGASIGFQIGGPIGAGIGASIGATAGLFAGIFGGGAKRRAEEVARRMAVQDSRMFEMFGGAERLGVFGGSGDSIVEPDLMGNLREFALGPTINISVSLLDGSQADYAMDRISQRVSRDMITGRHGLADNIAWAAGS